MSGGQPSEILRMSTQLFVATLAVWLVLAMLTGRIRLSWLLVHDSGASAIQLQLVLTASALSLKYAMVIAHTASPHTLPPLDATWLTLAVGSNGLLLARGLINRFINPGPRAR